MDCVYFLCDTTAGGYQGAVNTCRSAHNTAAPGTRLSVATFGTRAVIKVVNGAKGLINAPTVIGAYDQGERAALRAAMSAIAPLGEWANS